jgi:hypothetical protein
MKTVGITLFLLWSATSFAQDNMIGPGTLDGDIRELLVISNAAKLGDQMVDQLFSTYEKIIPDVPSELWKKVRSEMRTADFTELVVPVYAKHFNRNDIKGMITFYKSPVGKKLLENQGAIMRESMAIGMAWGKDISNHCCPVV